MRIFGEFLKDDQLEITLASIKVKVAISQVLWNMTDGKKAEVDLVIDS
jgi:hypothetical protein